MFVREIIITPLFLCIHLIIKSIQMFYGYGTWGAVTLFEYTYTKYSMGLPIGEVTRISTNFLPRPPSNISGTLLLSLRLSKT